MAAPKKKIISQQWYEKILQEINEIKNTTMPETLEVLKDARAQWDLSENSDYHAAKEKLSLLKRRTEELEEMIDDVEVVSEESVEATVSTSTVRYGSLVKVDIEDDKKYDFEIVWSWEVDVMDDLKISLDSPIGNAIDGKKKGDIVYVKLANGKRKVTILSVS